MRPKTKCIGARIFTETTQDKGKSYGERNVSARQLRFLVTLARIGCAHGKEVATSREEFVRMERMGGLVEAIRKEWAL
jgi:hypothetical protein